MAGPPGEIEYQRHAAQEGYTFWSRLKLQFLWFARCESGPSVGFLPFSSHIWSNIAQAFEIPVQRQNTFRQFYEVWMAKRIYHKTRKRLWIVTFFAVSWSLWMKRNSVVFEQQELDAYALCKAIQWRITLWSKAWKDPTTYTSAEIVRHFGSLHILYP